MTLEVRIVLTDTQVKQLGYITDSCLQDTVETDDE
jgi:hypothetical protein